jgi:hypothetical protein
MPVASRLQMLCIGARRGPKLAPRYLAQPLELALRAMHVGTVQTGPDQSGVGRLVGGVELQHLLPSPGQSRQVEAEHL